MFIYTLPYSREEFSIKPILFKNIIDIARLIYDDNDKGLANYLESLLGIEKLCIVDKFFVVLKAKQIFIDENISVNSNGKNINLHTNLIIEPLFNIESQKKELYHDKITAELDLPSKIITTNSEDIYLNIIKSISFQDVKIEFDGLSSEERDLVLTSLPATFIRTIRKFFSSVDLNYTVLKGIEGRISSININFFSNEPFNLIKTLIGGYDLLYCRDVLMFLSKKIDSNIIYNSSLADIFYFIQQLERNDETSSSSINGISL